MKNVILLSDNQFLQKVKSNEKKPHKFTNNLRNKKYKSRIM